MIKNITFLFYKILYYLNNIFFFVTKRNFLIYLKDFIERDSYRGLVILGNKVNFFTPNFLTDWRVKTFYENEPETIEWINTFDETDNFIFWDIGANIGLYSIYNSLKNRRSKTISFEPSSSNLRILTRNISINKLQNRINLFPIALTNHEKSFLVMNEGNFLEGAALNTYGEEFNFEGKKFNSNMKYSMFGTTINHLIDNEILDLPDYIKIDVDGIEHLILEGANKYLSNKKIKSLSIEINENFKEQYEKVLEIMDQNGFKLLHKKHYHSCKDQKNRFVKTFNYVFVR